MNPNRRKKLYRIGLLENSEKVEQPVEEKVVEQQQEVVEVVKESPEIVAEPEIVAPVVNKKSKKLI